MTSGDLSRTVRKDIKPAEPHATVLLSLSHVTNLNSLQTLFYLCTSFLMLSFLLIYELLQSQLAFSLPIRKELILLPTMAALFLSKVLKFVVRDGMRQWLFKFLILREFVLQLVPCLVGLEFLPNDATDLYAISHTSCRKYARTYPFPLLLILISICRILSQLLHHLTHTHHRQQSFTAHTTVRKGEQTFTGQNLSVAELRDAFETTFREYFGESSVVYDHRLVQISQLGSVKLKLMGIGSQFKSCYFCGNHFKGQLFQISRLTV